MKTGKMFLFLHPKYIQIKKEHRKWQTKTRYVRYFLIILFCYSAPNSSLLPYSARPNMRKDIIRNYRNTVLRGKAVREKITGKIKQQQQEMG